MSLAQAFPLPLSAPVYPEIDLADPTIVWFRKDLRLDDHPALAWAANQGGPVIPVFVWNPHAGGDWPPGAASRWWLQQSLRSLAQELNGRGSRLLLRTGNALDHLRQLAAETGARTIVASRCYEPAASSEEAALASALAGDGLTLQLHSGALLFEPEEIRTRTGGPFQVFTPFWKACQAQREPCPPLAAPMNLAVPESWPESVPLARLGLEPAIDWAAGLREMWRPGEEGAAAALRLFLREAAFAYKEERDRPGQQGTSRLSPHLHWGEISVRRVWHEILEQAAREAANGRRGALREPEAYLRQLGWREFAHHLLHHFPFLADEPMRTTLDGFPWRNDPPVLKAWQQGKTGYPIVDAGMRELWHTGWMHNRVRMIVASFLVKDLHVHWIAGARWFWDTLVDADLANNSLGWQWTAGCGADAAPYFRIFNPVTQGEKFDPEGVYVRRWVPELARIPTPWIHKPWEAPESVLDNAKMALGKDYPTPIVDHAIRRQEALTAYARLRRQSPR